MPCPEVTYDLLLRITKFPVLADGDLTIANSTPLTQMTHPELCALTPEMEIIKCTSGHKSHKNLFFAITDHAGI